MDKLLGRKRYIAFYVGVPFAFFAFFGLTPILYNLYLSLFKTNLLTDGEFVGLRNYAQMLRDQFFQKAFVNNLKFVVFNYIAHMGISLLLASLLYSGKLKEEKIYQSIIFLPSIICGTAIGLLWKFIYHPDFGILNKLLCAIGLESAAQNWLANKETVVPALVVAIMWQFVGYHMTIQLAAMRDIDKNVLEAAEIDGADGWTKLTQIVIPLIKPILAIDSVMIITGALKLYDIVSVTTNGGPNHASDVLSLYIFKQAFNNKNFGYASALSVVLLIVCVLITMGVKRLFREKE